MRSQSYSLARWRDGSGFSTLGETGAASTRITLLTSKAQDPKELIKELEAKGIKVDETRIHGEGPGYSVYVIDPSGNRLELSKTRFRQTTPLVSTLNLVPDLWFLADRDPGGEPTGCAQKTGVAVARANELNAERQSVRALQKRQADRGHTTERPQGAEHRIPG